VADKLVNTVAVGFTGLSFLAALEAVREFTQLCSRKYPWVPQYFTGSSPEISAPASTSRSTTLTVVISS